MDDGHVALARLHIGTLSRFTPRPSPLTPRPSCRFRPWRRTTVHGDYYCEERFTNPSISGNGRLCNCGKTGLEPGENPSRGEPAGYWESWDGKRGLAAAVVRCSAGLPRKRGGLPLTQMRPRCTANRVSSARLESPSLRIRLARWKSTVLTLMKRVSATSWYVLP